MNEEKDQILQNFLASIASLYADIDSWLDNTQLKTFREEIELREEACGAYKSQKLSIIKADGTRVADIIPVGAWVIGARGRADLKGKRDEVILVDLEEGGPKIISTVKWGDHEETSETKFYNGIKEAGWYWVEDRRRGKAHRIDKELFYELLTEVSDYEFRQSS